MQSDTTYRITKALRNTGLYALLTGGTAIFVLPFLIMLGTSIKMDREMGKSGLNLMPEKPVPAQQSPYLDTSYFAGQVDETFRTVVQTAIAAHRPDLPAEHLQGIWPGVLDRLKQSLPNEVWDLPTAERDAALIEAVTPELVHQIESKITRQLSFRSIRVKSVDLQERELTTGIDPSSLWNLEGASLHSISNRAGRAAALHYDFSERGEQELRMVADLQLPFAAQRLHRLQIGLQPDDSWHAFSFTLEYAGTRYRAMRGQHTGDTQARVITLQPFGPDDASDSMRIRSWIPYQPEAQDPAADHGPNTVRVIATLRESSDFTAWRLKSERNYVRTFNYTPFWRYAATSLVLVLLNIIGTMFSCSIAAYAFARMEWPGRNLGFGLMMATMMIPPQVTMIPFFLIIRSLGWYNTLTPLWVMSLFGNAFNIFLLRQFIKGIPRDLEDAARIDGCHFMQIYWHVIVPLIKPTLACIAVFTFTGIWNDFMGPLIFLSDQRLYPLSLGLYALQVQDGGNTGMMMAGSLLMTIPVVALFFAAQRYFIQGIALTGTKG